MHSLLKTPRIQPELQSLSGQVAASSSALVRKGMDTQLPEYTRGRAHVETDCRDQGDLNELDQLSGE